MSTDFDEDLCQLTRQIFLKMEKIGKPITLKEAEASAYRIMIKEGKVPGLAINDHYLIVTH